MNPTAHRLIKAGDGGFVIYVQGNTDLKSSVIASTDRAVQDGNNTLITGTPTQSDPYNFMRQYDTHADLPPPHHLGPSKSSLRKRL